MRLLFASLCTVVCALPAAALAGSLQVGPISIGMVGKERTSTVTVRNPGAEPMNVQVRTVDWSQPNGEDSYAPSSTLVASPPTFVVPAGQSQVVRVVITNTESSANERAWRLIFDELPPPRSAGATGVSVPIRILVPVFLTPSLTARPALKWQAARSGPGVKVTVANTGPVHERLMGLSVSSGGAAVSGPDPLYGYVLAGSSRSWSLKGGGTATSLSAKGQGVYGPVKADLRVTD